MNICPECQGEIQPESTTCRLCKTTPSVATKAASRSIILALSVAFLLGCTIAAARCIYSVVQLETTGAELTRSCGLSVVALLLGVAVGITNWVTPRWRARIWILAGVMSIALSGSVFYARSWKEMQAYRADTQGFLSSLDVLQSDVRQPAQLDEDLQRSLTQWNVLSRHYSTLCGHLPSYQFLNLTLRDYMEGTEEFKKALSQRHTVLSRASLAVDAPSAATASPEADLAYRKTLKEKQRQWLPAIQAARRKAKEARAKAGRVQRRAEEAQAGVQAAKNRVESAERNQSKEWNGQADPFSAEFNSNRDPYKALEEVYKQESAYTELQQLAETLEGNAQEAQQLATEVEEEAKKDSVKQAEEARQKVWEQFDDARLQAQRDAMNKDYRRWSDKVEFQRIRHWAHAARHVDRARRALAQESTMQALTSRVLKAPPATDDSTPAPVLLPIYQGPSPAQQSTPAVRGTGIALRKQNDQFLVSSVTPGSPANRGGIQVGDAICWFNEEGLQGKTLDQANSLMDGELDGELVIVFQRPGQESQEVRLTPDPLAARDVSKSPTAPPRPPARDPFQR